MRRAQRETASRLIVFAGAYAVATWVGLASTALGPSLPVSWPASGVALATLLLIPRREWPAALALVFVTAGVLGILDGIGAVAALGLAAASTLQPAAGAWVLTRLARERIDFRRQQDVVALAFVSIAVCGVTALLGAILATSPSDPVRPESVLAWWVAGAISVLVLTPAIVTVVRGGPSPRRWSTPVVVEVAAWFLVLVGLTVFVFGPSDVSLGVVPRPYMLFPVIVWSALRLGVTPTAVAQCAIATIALALTTTGTSGYPLGGSDEIAQGIYVQLFFCVASVTGLLLAAALAERMRTEASLRTSETRYRAVADFTQSWETWVSPDLAWVYVSPACEPITGYTREEFVADPALETRIAHPEDRELVRAHFEPFEPDASPDVELTYRIIRRDGDTRWIEHRCRPIHDDDGSFLGRRATNRDITAQRCLEVRLRDSEAHLRLVSDTVPAFVAYVGADLRYRSVNRPYATYVGREESWILGRTPEEVLGSAAWERIRPFVERALAGERVTYEMQVPIAGRPAPDWLRASYLPDERDGAVHGFIVMVEDISEQKHVEGELRWREKRYRLLTETMRDVVWSLDPETLRFTYVSPSVYRLRGFTPEEVIAEPMDAALTPEAAAAVRQDVAADLEKVRAGVITPDSFFVSELLQPRRDGSCVWTDATTSYHVDPDTGRIEVYGVTRDISERKQAEEALRASARMEAIGQLAGGIAHDFNNLLTAIRGFADFLRADMPPDDRHVTDVDEIIRAADRAAELTRSLLAYSRRQVMQPQVVDPAAHIEDLAPMLRRIVGEQVALTTHDEAPGAHVSVDPSQLDQVIVNLAVNARHAMPDGGDLTIGTSATEVDAAGAGMPADVRRGRYVVISVADTGSGMDVDTLGHIFEPFFSTREPGIGSGMGLATVDGIVRQSGGFVLVESAPGAGSTFRIHLPRIEQGAPPAQQDEDGGIPRLAGQETILVVEDDRMVRTFVRRTLASIGYAVLDAASGDEALALSRSTVRIDLLLTDMRMPGLQGRRLAEMLTESRPGLAVIFMTGFDEETVRDGLQRPADARVVMKPFTSETLAHVVREALDGRP